MHNALWLSATDKGALHRGYGSRRYGLFTRVERGDQEDRRAELRRVEILDRTPGSPVVALADVGRLE